MYKKILFEMLARLIKKHTGMLTTATLIKGKVDENDPDHFVFTYRAHSRANGWEDKSGFILICTGDVVIDGVGVLHIYD